MRTKSYISLSALLLSSLFFVLAGCSGSGSSSGASASQSGQGAISAKLVWSESGSKTTAKSVASAPVGVATVRLAISGVGMTTIQQDFPAADGSGTLYGIPAGSGLTLTAYGLNASGSITHQGTVRNVTVQIGLTTDVGTVTMQIPTPAYSNATLNGPWLLLLPDGTAHDYFTFNGNGLSIDSSTYNQLTGSYIVQTSGNYTLNTPRTNALTEYASGILSSSTTGSFILGVDSNGPAGVYSIVKVSNPAACQGAWNATLVETVGGATYNVAYAVDANGAVSSFSGFTGPVTGHMYSEASMLSSFFTTGRSDAYNQFAIWGSLSGDDATGTYDNENASNDVGTVIFKRYFTLSAIVGKTIYWADQGGYGYFRFTSDGKFYGTGNINNGESAEAGPGTYTVEDRGVVSFQIPSVGSGTDTFLSNNFAGEYWRVQLLSGTYERWFYGANAAADAQAFYLSGIAP